MIAPAMNTRPQETLSYRDLARQQARISRPVSLKTLPRLHELVEQVLQENPAEATRERRNGAAFVVDLQFRVDARGFCRVTGELTGQLPLNCNGCAEVLDHPLAMSFACIIVETEALADGLVEDGRSGGDTSPTEDVLVAGGTEVTVAQIVEDEILLNLPERLCLTEPCERAPALAYPAADNAEDGGVGKKETATGNDDSHPDGEENPFSVLAGLKLGNSREDD